MLKMYRVVSLLRELGQEVLKRVNRGVEGVREKNRNDYVSEIDLFSEKELRRKLPMVYPSPVVGEEMGGEVGEEYWLVDPLDGTRNVLRGYPVFSIAVSLVRKGRVEFGCVEVPFFRWTLWGERGKGLWLNGKPVKNVVRWTSLEGALMGFNFPFSMRKYSREAGNFVADVTKRGIAVRRSGSAVLDGVLFALGKYDLFLGVGLKPWDVATTILFAVESGAEVCGDTNSDVVYAYSRDLKEFENVVLDHFGDLISHT